MSKCIKVCKLDPSGSYCVGCNRTTLEIMKAGINKPNETQYQDTGLDYERYIDDTLDKH